MKKVLIINICILGSLLISNCCPKPEDLCFSTKHEPINFQKIDTLVKVYWLSHLLEKKEFNEKELRSFLQTNDSNFIHYDNLLTNISFSDILNQEYYFNLTYSEDSQQKSKYQASTTDLSVQNCIIYPSFSQIISISENVVGGYMIYFFNPKKLKCFGYLFSFEEMSELNAFLNKNGLKRETMIGGLGYFIFNKKNQTIINGLKEIDYDTLIPLLREYFKIDLDEGYSIYIDIY